MANTIRYRLWGDSAENWESKNPVLLKNEPGYDVTNRRLKFGDGIHNWNELEYVAPDVIDDLISGGSDKALSAEQGKVLKRLVDGIDENLTELTEEFNEFTQEFTTNVTEITENKLDLSQVTHETWVFTLEDESTLDKEVVLWNL